MIFWLLVPFFARNSEISKLTLIMSALGLCHVLHLLRLHLLMCSHLLLAVHAIAWRHRRLHSRLLRDVGLKNE